MSDLAITSAKVTDNWITPDWPAPAGVKAIITTRAGGVSEAPFNQLNLGAHVGDEPTAVAKNRNLLIEALGLTHQPQWLEQVHGARVVEAKADGLVRTADGVFSREKKLACAIMTADCLPILLCDINGTEVAALHCGWRSLAKGICGEALKELKSSPSNLMAYLGPAISQANFEVGVDVLEAFFDAARNDAHADAIGQSFKPALRPLHFYADIYGLARAELNALGITQIYGGEHCTVAETDTFFSYRRDKTTGRMASLIWLDE
jgi:YfiH family protein